MRTPGPVGSVAVALVLVLASCAGADGRTGRTGASDGGASGGGASSGEVTLPPSDAVFDYQLGGAYPPAEGTQVVVRDATADPAPGTYSVCYLNAFQSQPDHAGDWDGLLLERKGEPVADPDWPDEYLLDTSTSAHRTAIAEALAPQIAGCAQDGFQAVEFDNLDSYERSHGALTLDDNLDLARELIGISHEHGLAVAQKNTVDAATQGKDAGFDLAITEDCGAFDECGAYQDVHDVVLDIEYADADEFAQLCAHQVVPADAIRRDLDLVTPQDEGYVLERCS